MEEEEEKEEVDDEEKETAPRIVGTVWGGRMGDKKAVKVLRAMAGRIEEAHDAAVVERRRVAANVPRNWRRRRPGRAHISIFEELLFFL